MIRILAEARDEVVDAADWYDRQAPGIGDDFLAAVDEALERIEAYPRIGQTRFQVRGQSVRRIPVAAFPYSVFYLGTTTGLLVVAVASDQREPGYWISRVL